MRYFALEDITLADGSVIHKGNSFESNIDYPSNVATKIEENLNIVTKEKEVEGWREPLENREEVNEEPETVTVNQFPGKVEIILIRYNLKDVEDKAIKKVRENTEYPYTLNVFDNYKKNIPLSELWNQLIEESNCEYICLLNSDVFVTKGWLKKIMKGFEFNHIAAVGPSGDKVGGIQREIGTEKLAREYRNSFKNMVGKDTLSGFCLVLKKSAWREVGGFPKEVPFYGGEHAFLVAAREAGWKLIWAQGAFVYHLGEASSKKAGTAARLRKQGPRQYLEWLEPRIPILFTTYNRLEYTKKALENLLEKTNGNKIIVFDNNSTDGTKEWLQSLESDRLDIYTSSKNIGVSGAMNEFFKITKNKEFVAKVDNDTLIPDGWLEELLRVAEEYKVDILQPKHKILHPTHKTYEEWMKELRGDETIRYSDYVGGAGILIRRAEIDNFIPEKALLGGWTQWQVQHPDLKKVFCNSVEIKLLDMIKDNRYNLDKYPDYYKEVGRANGLEEERGEEVVQAERIEGGLNVKGCFETVEAILDRLDKKFAYTRFGDGELLMMEKGFEGLQYTQYNSKEFQDELEMAFRINHPDYLIAVSAGAENEKGMKKGLFARFDNDDELQDIVREYHYEGKTFYNPIAFYYLLVFYPHFLKQAFDRFNTKKLGFIGGKHLKGMKDFLDVEFISIPEEQAFSSIEKWYPRVKKSVEGLDLVLISGGPTTEVLQSKLWEDTDVSTIDLGSVSSAITQYEKDLHTWIKISQEQIKKFINLYL